MELRSSLVTCSRELAFKPFDEGLRRKCFWLHKKYIKSRRAKRKNYFSNLMKHLESISNKNPRAFWDLINKFKVNATADSEGAIDSSTWKDFFET